MEHLNYVIKGISSKNLIPILNCIKFELNETGGEIVQQIIRPTGLLDPLIEVRDADNPIYDLVGEIDKVIAKKERVMVVTLTIKEQRKNNYRYINN